MPDKYQNKYRIFSARASWWDYRNDAAYFVTICTKDRRHYFGQVVADKMVLSQVGIIADILWHEINNHSKNVVLDEFIVMPNHIHGILILNNGNLDDVNKINSKSVQGETKLDGVGNPIPAEMFDAGSLPVDGLPAVETLHATSLQATSLQATSLRIIKPKQNDQPNPNEQPKSNEPENLNQKPNKPGTQNPKPTEQESHKNKSTGTNINMSSISPKPNSLSTIMRSYKSAVTKHAHRLGFEFDWQSRFHDHIIRNQAEYDRIGTYIKNNPANWKDDKFFKE